MFCQHLPFLFFFFFFNDTATTEIYTLSLHDALPIFPPVLAAKQIVTADHIGRGRFGLNIVCGWNQDEFDMFGLEQDAHDDRYARGQEWLEVLLRLWSENAPFDYNGRYYRLKGVMGRPRPWGGRRPIL